jgi:ABC-type sugar transport system permease subunit
MKRKTSFYIIFIPWLLIFLVFTIGLLGFNIFVSLTDWHGIMPSYKFVGLSNYIALPQTAGFITTLLNVLLLFGVGVPSGVFISIIVGTVLDLICKKKFALSIMKTIVILPMSIGAVIVASFWVWMFDFDFGGINGLLRAIGLESLASNWLGSPDLVLFMIIIVLVWKFSGFGSLILFGGMQSIPTEQIEAASLEGTSYFKTYLHIIFPQIGGHILTLALLLSMYMLKSFGYIWPLTGGGPGWSSTLFPVLVYRQMFPLHDVAAGAATATFMVIVVSILAIPYIKLTFKEAKGT